MEGLIGVRNEGSASQPPRPISRQLASELPSSAAASGITEIKPEDQLLTLVPRLHLVYVPIPDHATVSTLLADSSVWVMIAMRGRDECLKNANAVY
jgi:hypothetical protein